LELNTSLPDNMREKALRKANSKLLESQEYESLDKYLLGDNNPFCKSGKKQRNSTSGNQKLTRKDAIKQRLKLKKMLICIWQLEEDAECIFAEISEEK
jgi:hypothetical protein